MRKICFTLAFALILSLSLCGSAFASQIDGFNNNIKVTQQGVEKTSLIQGVEKRSNGLTATASRINSSYIRVVFKNSTSSKISETCYLADAAITGEVISGPFSISVPAKGTKSYDVYVGTHQPTYYLTTNNYGYFSFNI